MKVDGTEGIDFNYLTERIHRQELGLLVRALHQIDVDQLMRQCNERKKQLHTVRVARQGVAVELDRLGDLRGHGRFRWMGGAAQ